MNMTSADNVEVTGEPQNAPAMTPEQFQLFQAKLLDDPEYKRFIKNRQRVKANYEQLMAMDPEQRSRILFTDQCHLMTAREEADKRREKSSGARHSASNVT